MFGSFIIAAFGFVDILPRTVGVPTITRDSKNHFLGFLVLRVGLPCSVFRTTLLSFSSQALIPVCRSRCPLDKYEAIEYTTVNLLKFSRMKFEIGQIISKFSVGYRAKAALNVFCSSVRQRRILNSLPSIKNFRPRRSLSERKWVA